MGDVIQVDFEAAAARRGLVSSAHAVNKQPVLSAPQQLMLAMMNSRLSEEQMLEFQAALADAQCFDQATGECQLMVELFQMMSDQENV